MAVPGWPLRNYHTNGCVMTSGENAFRWGEKKKPPFHETEFHKRKYNRANLYQRTWLFRFTSQIFKKPSDISLHVCGQINGHLGYHFPRRRLHSYTLVFKKKKKYQKKS